jgi:hypothetical protein
MSIDGDSGPPPAALPQSPPVPAAPPPQQVKVLGILHLVFAGIGTVGVAIGVMMLLFKEAMFHMQENAGELQAQQAQFSRAVMEATNVVNWYGYVANLLLAALLLVAGIGLLKRKLGGLRWSMIYAWTSIVTKVGNLLLFSLLVIPKLDKLFAGLDLSSPMLKMMGPMMRTTTIASGVLTPILTCIYPILVLILVNRDSVKKS